MLTVTSYLPHPHTTANLLHPNNQQTIQHVSQKLLLFIPPSHGEDAKRVRNCISRSGSCFAEDKGAYRYILILVYLVSRFENTGMRMENRPMIISKHLKPWSLDRKTHSTLEVTSLLQFSNSKDTSRQYWYLFCNPRNFW